MFFFVIGAVAFIVGIIAACIALASKESRSIATSIVAFIIAVILIGLSCVANVPTGHTGVLTTFGRVEDRTLEAGMNFKAPWQNVVRMDNRVQKESTDLVCFSSDIQEVTMKYTVNYQISSADAMTIYKTIGTDYYNNVIITDKSMISKDDKSSGIKSCGEALAKQLIKNTYKTLLTRGQKGCYIYCEDKELLKHMREMLKIEVED